MKLLAINIPTYERLDSFSEVMCELENECSALRAEFKSMLEVNVFDNDSSCSLEKKVVCHDMGIRSGVEINFRKNGTNIGGDQNIQKCCTAAADSKFTWVLGDDDHLVAGCLPKILGCLLDYADSLGLLILADDEYPVQPELKNKLFDSYLTFARSASQVQPHFLIAHTLISANIFRTDLFEDSEAAYVTNLLTPRLGLVANFSHMRGLVKGLLYEREVKYCVLTPDFLTLDTTRRLPSAVNFDGELFKIYYFYFLWLLSEIGVRVDEVAHQSTMSWLFESKRAALEP